MPLLYLFLFCEDILKTTTKKNTKKRLIAVSVLFAICGCYLLYNIFYLSNILHEYYKDKTFDQVTVSSPLGAERGAIYDSNMNLLAKSDTVWRIFISTKDIRLAEKETDKNISTIIASGLASILSIKEETILNKITSSNVLDVTIKKEATAEEYKKTLEFIINNNLEDLVFTESSTSRYYPCGAMAAHVLGFTGSDNQGLYGLEYYYDDILSGEDGYYIYARDANGNVLDTEYSSYIPSKDGYSIVTTLDSYIQEELENILETVRVNHGVENRVTGIVMDTSTGAILAMATTSPFDPNNPFVLDELSQNKLDNCGYPTDSDKYKEYKNDLLQTMWSNKAVSETYEPGSTFKIITVSAALETGTATLSDRFTCNGFCQIGGWKIKCHKTSGHGSGFDLAYGLQMSCNPCMIAISSKLGAESFYSYVKKFGYLEKSGIDLPSEATTIFHEKENIGSTELATASFGQRFKVSIINHLTAISSVANGGKLVTPYVVDKIIDSNGTIISEHQTTIRREVISEDVANTVSQILIDGVSGDGGAKNAAVSGYDIAAKTGTSQKFDILDDNGNSYLRISSTVAYSIDENSGISVIIVADEPTSQVKYGSVVAAPYVSDLLEKLLPYMEYKSSSPEINTQVKDYVGMNINTVISDLKNQSISYEIIGSGGVVLAQTPSADNSITLALSKIILYTVKTVPDYITVPKLTGKSPKQAIELALNAGLNIRLLGAISYNESNTVISYQSLPPDDKAIRGSVIILRAINANFED